MSDVRPVWGLVSRSIAVAIAVLGVIDPAVTRSRVSGSVVSVVHSGSHADSLRAAEVAARLRTLGVSVTGARAPGDAASVVVGARRPAMDTGAPVIVYAPSAVAITAVDVPSNVRLTSRVPVTVTLAAERATNATVELLDEDRVVARASRELSRASVATVALDWSPSVIGTRLLTVRASTAAATATATATSPATDTQRVSRAVLVDSTPWRVLAYDARPSWNATFIRRALERDGRFDVRSRVVTSRAPQALVARGSSRAPASLSSLDARSVDVIVVGAPEGLPAGDLAALKRLVTNDGVSAVLLPDDASPALSSWLATSAWRTTPHRDPVAMRTTARGADSTAVPTLQALIVGAPASLPDGSETLLALRGASVVWRQLLGSGDVVVSGAFDAWRFRDSAQSAFDGFWREVIAAQASRRASRIAVDPTSLTLRPDERRMMRIESAQRPAVRWRADSGSSDVAVSPTTSASTWLAAPPLGEGDARGALVVSAAADSVRLPWVSSNRSGGDLSDPPEVSRAWANAQGGQLVGTLDSLVGAIQQRSQARPEPLPWHPMRSGWWIVPFTLALAADWWLRRREGRT